MFGSMEKYVLSFSSSQDLARLGVHDSSVMRAFQTASCNSLRFGPSPRYSIYGVDVFYIVHLHISANW